jgi:hypothetical protein
MVSTLNRKLRGVVDILSNFGVFYVEEYSEASNTHRFCQSERPGEDFGAGSTWFYYDDSKLDVSSHASLEHIRLADVRGPRPPTKQLHSRDLPEA